MKLKYIKSLDGVRGFAALAIMFFHYSRHYILEGSAIKNGFQRVSIFGQTSVTLFFVLSGFLITRILLSTKTQKAYFSTFYFKRAIRIFPLYYLFLVIYYFIAPAIGTFGFIPFGQQWYFWVYLQNFAITFNWNYIGPNHYWSLGVEEHFYLIWPLFVYFIPVNKLRFAVLFLIGISLALRVILLKAGYGVFYFTFTNLDALSLGALLAIQERHYGLESFSAKKFGVIIIAFLIPALVMWNLTGGKGLDIIQAVKPLLLSVIFCSFIGLIISKDRSLLTGFIFRNKYILYTGKISYGLYVYHPLVFLLYSKYTSINSYSANLVLCFGIAYIISAASYHLFESKLLGIKARLP